MAIRCARYIKTTGFFPYPVQLDEMEARFTYLVESVLSVIGKLERQAQKDYEKEMKKGIPKVPTVPRRRR